jgi:hypothetical protein
MKSLSLPLGPVFAAAASLAAVALPAATADAFDITKLTLRGGAGYISGDPGSLQVGAGVGYFVYDGLEVGLSADARFLLGDSASEGNLYIVGPYATYHLGMIPIITPYAGVFYRRWIYSGYPEIIDFTGFENSIGVRAGVAYSTTPLFRIFGGIVYETFLGCDDPGDAGICSDWYPEIGVRISF